MWHHIYILLCLDCFNNVRYVPCRGSSISYHQVNLIQILQPMVTNKCTLNSSNKHSRYSTEHLKECIKLYDLSVNLMRKHQFKTSQSKKRG